MLSTIVFSLPVINFKITKIYNYNTNLIINNDGARLQDSIMLLKIPLDTRKKFAKNYLQFGHGLSKRFASPGLQPSHNGRLRYGMRDKMKKTYGKGKYEINTGVS